METQLKWERLVPMNERDIEARIIADCQRGDMDAFRRLFDMHKDRVYSIAFHYSADHSMASDVTQQVFLKLFTRIGQFRRDSEFTTWLYRVVANTCNDERRKLNRLVQFPADLPESPSKARQEERLLRRQVKESVRQAISELSPKLRLPVILKYIEDLSYEEISEAMGISMGTVASRLNRGHKQLAQKLAHLRSAVAPE